MEEKEGSGWELELPGCISAEGHWIGISGNSILQVQQQNYLGPIYYLVYCLYVNYFKIIILTHISDIKNMGINYLSHH